MEFLNASVRTEMPSFNKVMPHDQDADFHTFTIH